MQHLGALVESGADINFFGKCVEINKDVVFSVLHIAVVTENVGMVKYLIEKMPM